MKVIVHALLLLLALSFSPAMAQQELEPDSSSPPLVLTIGAESLSFDPHIATTAAEAELSTAVYEGLVTYDPETLEPVPAVATSWVVSEDKLRITFFLRTEAAFDTGDPIVASDFRESWLRLLSPEMNAKYAFLLDSVAGASDYRTGRSKDERTVGIRVLAARVLEVALLRPDPGFLKILAHHALVPLHRTRRSVDEGLPHAASVVIGNGPFRLTRRTADGTLEFRRSDTYWDRNNVAIDRIIVRRSKGPVATSREYNAGITDWVLADFDTAALSDLRAIRINPLFTTRFLFFRVDRAPWNDEHIRKALALLLPLEDLRGESRITPAALSLVPRIPGYPRIEGIRGENRTRAERLLQAAGYPGGAGLPTIRIWIPSGGSNGTTRSEESGIAQILEKNWSHELSAPVTETSKEEEFEFTVAIATWAGAYADPSTFLDMWKSDSPMNTAGYHNATYDGLLEHAALETGTARYQTLSRAEGMLLESAVIVPLNHTSTRHLIDSERISGWYTNPLDIHPLKYLALRRHAPAPGIACSEDLLLVSAHTAR